MATNNETTLADVSFSKESSDKILDKDMKTQQETPTNSINDTSTDYFGQETGFDFNNPSNDFAAPPVQESTNDPQNQPWNPSNDSTTPPVQESTSDPQNQPWNPSSNFIAQDEPPVQKQPWDSGFTQNADSIPAPQNQTYRLTYQILDLTAFDNKDNSSEIRYLNVAFNIKYGNLRFSLFAANGENKSRKTTINLNYRNVLLFTNFLEHGGVGRYDLVEPIHNQDSFDVMNTYRPNKTAITNDASGFTILNTVDMNNNSYQFVFDKVDIFVLLSTLKFALKEGVVLTGQYIISNQLTS